VLYLVLSILFGAVAQAIFLMILRNKDDFSLGEEQLGLLNEGGAATTEVSPEEGDEVTASEQSEE
jgi:hypothetical protein